MEKPIESSDLEIHPPSDEREEGFNKGTSRIPAPLFSKPWHESLAVGGILLFGLLVRLVFFSGDGLGDDANQFLAFKNIYDGNIVNSPYYHRFSYWLPQIIIWKLFGFSEFTFILPVLLSSLGCIYLVYLITRDLFGEATGLIAASLMAVDPFEVLNATLMSTDVNLSFYILVSVYFFMRAQENYSKFFFFLSALFVLFCFVNKPFGLFVLPVIALFCLKKEGLNILKISKYWSFVFSLGFVFGALFGFSWYFTGDPLVYLNIYKEGKEPFHAFVMDRFQMLIYPRQMFLPYDTGQRLHGFYFYTVVGALLFIRKRNFKIILPVLGWFLLLFSLINFLPHKIEDSVPYTAGRLFRYFVFVVPPSIIFVSFFWGRLLIWKKGLFTIVFGVYIVASLIWCASSTSVSRIAFGEMREGAKYVLSLGEGKIYSDWAFNSRIERLLLGGDFGNPRLQSWHRAIPPKELKKKILSVKKGFVVTGGARLPYHGCIACIPNLGPTEPPENWELIKEFDDTVYPPWKTEPLRIWRVTPVDTPGRKEEIQEKLDLQQQSLIPKHLGNEEARKIYLKAIKVFDEGNCPEARPLFQKVAIEGGDSDLVDESLYFTGVCHVREQNWEEAISVFQTLFTNEPESIWIAGGRYHVGLSYRANGDFKSAEENFRYVIKKFPKDKTLVALSQAQIEDLPGNAKKGFFERLFNGNEP